MKRKVSHHKMIVGSTNLKEKVFESKRKWSLSEDYVLCKTILDHGQEHLKPNFKSIQNAFTPTPVELQGRTHFSLFRRFVLLQPSLREHLFETSCSRNSSDELYKWLRTRHVNAAVHSRNFSFEEDLALCRAVVKSWHENRGPCVPNKTWFEQNVAGKNPTLGKRSSNSLYRRYQHYLSPWMESAVVAHDERWSFVRIDFSWLQEQHGLNVLKSENSHVIRSYPCSTCEVDFGVEAEQPLGHSCKASLGSELPLWHHEKASAFENAIAIVCVATTNTSTSITTVVRPGHHSSCTSPDSVPERPSKRGRTLQRFTYEEDECICLTVLRDEFDEFEHNCTRKLMDRTIGQIWFQSHLLDKGLLNHRSCNSLYRRFWSKLRAGLLINVTSECASAESRGATLSLEAVERRVLDWLRELHYG